LIKLRELLKINTAYKNIDGLLNMLKFVHTMSEDIITNINVFNNPSTFYIYIYIYY